jgi:DNA helicase-2/ATP-dependent DNA helicase PcrA
MVIAGPGTGKTELLGVRIANILQKTDTLPENILCLTFTDSGANAMRQRLTEIIGKVAYKIAIHTFHSFGSEVINQNGQYFYQGAHFRPSDSLSSYEIIRDIFDGLDYSSPIASKMNGEYTYISDSLTAISELKKAGLTSGELLRILDDNDAVIQKTEQLLSPIFADRISKNTAIKAATHIEAIRDSNGNVTLQHVAPLSEQIANTLETATNNSIELNSTKPITAWRNQWFTKNKAGDFVLKTRERQIKLRSLSIVYERYISNMQEKLLYDFDDMIMNIVHTMETQEDLRFNLQEQYQYIMVDEFQDTNMAQMRILDNLTNNEIHGDTPNILVVGDDDQAIYSFQGADISNILDFQKRYPRVKKIVLTENYRSTADILDGSRKVITQGTERLENLIEGINKQLTAHNPSTDNCVYLHEAITIADERHWIASDIKKRIESGQKPNEIAVFTRRHHEINALLPYFYHFGIAVNYERSDNVLDQAPIILIEKLAKILIDLSHGRHDNVNAQMPELLSHPAWGIAPIELWKLSVKAYDSHTRWLDIMATTPEFLPLHKWIIITASAINITPLEHMLDIIIGNPNIPPTDDGFISPFYEYFFSSEKLVENPNEYLLHLEALKTIRSKLREYRPDQIPTLNSFIDFISLNRKIGSTISTTRRSTNSDDAINVMTAHKSKGLEFNTVYISNAIDTAWGERARSRNRLINYPENLRIAPAGESTDERLRLFYVAMTRAKKELHISYSQSDENSKNTLRAGFLLNSKYEAKPIETPSDEYKLTESAELAWYQPLIDPTTPKMHDLLMPTIENYKLSVTHLHNFLDVSRGGPSTFLLQNLLHFPSAKSPSAAFGTAIHDTLQKAHAHFTATGKKQAVEDIISDFELTLKNQHLMPKDFEKFMQKGSDLLQIYFNKKYDTFTTTQQTELNFAGQHSIVGEAHLTGKLDLVDINKSEKSIAVTDYKTGKSPHSWSGKDEFEKIKLHKYKQQLLFYKLLVENARDWRGYRVELGTMQFVEPDKSDNIISLDIEFNNDDLEYFSKLINAVWVHIKDLNLPDISGYDKSYKGILAFEQDLIDSII